MMPLAYNLTRREVHYRHECFSKGLAHAGYQVHTTRPEKCNPGDVLLIWNRYGEYHDLAVKFEKLGGTVVVAENGYLGKDENGQQRYALARHAHNGRGQWEIGGPERFAELGIELQPWREAGDHILVCPNRSFGMPGMIMPPDWTNDVVRRLKKLTQREIRVRPHPGNSLPKKPLEDDLAGAHAVVIWASSAGVHALVAGIPVICESPYWICKEAGDVIESIERPAFWGRGRGRGEVLQELAWAQWTLAEIESGHAFDHLLRPTRQSQITAAA
jgi:hypothetical protein